MVHKAKYVEEDLAKTAKVRSKGADPILTV